LGVHLASGVPARNGLAQASCKSGGVTTREDCHGAKCAKC
jgi:hypothetical protein